MTRLNFVWAVLGASFGILAMAVLGYVPRWSVGYRAGFGLVCLAAFLLWTERD